MQSSCKYRDLEFQISYSAETTAVQFVEQAAKIAGKRASRLRLQFDTLESQQKGGRKRYLNTLAPLLPQIEKHGNKFLVKYVGIQIDYQTVFLAEYIGPIAIWLVLNRSSLLSAASALWLGHYVKRVLETLFVHRFSNATMPIRNLFKNCAYYWAFAAANAYNSPRTPFAQVSFLQKAAMCLFVFAELMNFYTHMVLRNLRPSGSTEYVNPTNPLFRHVACPNYGFEVLAWVAFTLFARTLSAAAFTAAGLYQILEWAADKRKRLNAAFGDKTKRRWLIFWGL